MQLKIIYTILLSSLIISYTYGQQTKNNTNDTSGIVNSVNHLQDIIVTASRKAEIIGRTPASVQVLNSKDITTQIAISGNISTLIAQKIPALSMNTNQTGNTGQTLRGRSALIMIDGIPQSTPLRPGARDMRTIDPAVIERIEVVKGATAIYGNGGDGGVINYITKKASGDKAFNAYSSIAGTLHPLYASETMGMRATQQFTGNIKKIDYVVNGTYEKTGVFKDADGIANSPTYTLGQSDIYNGFAKAGYSFNDNHRIEAMYNYFGSVADPTYVEQYGKYNVTPTVGIKGKHIGEKEGTKYNNNLYVKYTAKNRTKSTLEAVAYLQNFYTVYGFSSSFQNGGQSTIKAEKKGFRLNQNTPYKFASWLTGDITYGVDVLKDKTSQILTDGRTWVPEMKMTNTAPYAQAAANLWDNVVLKAGYRFDHISINIPNFTQVIDNKGKGGKLIEGGSLAFNAGSFNAGIRYSKYKIFNPFFGFTQGFSIGDFGRFIRQSATANVAKMQLEPVKVNSYEVGFSSELGWLTFTGSYFMSKNKIGSSYIEVDGWLTLQKAPEIRYGYEFAVDAKPCKNVTTGIAYAYIEGKIDKNNNNEFNDDKDTYINGLSITPPKGSVYINYQPSPKATLQLQSTFWNSRKRFTAKNDGTYANSEGPVNADYVVNLSGSYQLTPKITFNLGVENLLNHDYFLPLAQWSARDDNYSKAPGMKAQVGVSVKW